MSTTLTRRPLRSRPLAVLCVGALLTVLAGGTARADDISNTLDNSVDAVAEAMPLTVGGGNGTTTLYINQTNGDGKNGCNLTGGTTLGLNLVSSNTSVATVSPSSVTFTSCGDTKIVTVTPVAAGTASISALQTSNNTEGTFNLAPVTFTVSVTAATPTNTAPSIAVGGVTGGASYDKGSVPAATCQVTDAQDGSSSFPATLSAVTGTYATDGIGSQTASCSYTDGGGLTASGSETYAIVDPSAPVISSTLNPAAPTGTNGWYTGNVTLGWTVTEPQSPISLDKTGCVDQSVTADQVAITYTCSATSAGGSADEQSVTVKRDATAPSVAYTSATGSTGSNGWYTGAVTATFTGTDATSGPASATHTATSVGEGAAVSVASPVFTDLAGNSSVAGAAVKTFPIDLTDPTASFGSTIGSVYFGSVPAAPTCTAADGTSGPAGCVVSGYSTAVGTHTLTATATDNAGRTGTATQQYTVMAWTARGFYQPVDMNGVLNSVKGGSTVPVKFELFAGATELTEPSQVTMSAKKIACASSVPIDDIEIVATGSTSLRYDATGGQFVYNWKTPTGAGTCYQLTMTAADGSTLSAGFKLK